jgi:peptidoglycan LD-endopeptidase LytH
MDTGLLNIITRNQNIFHGVVDFDPATQTLSPIDLSDNNPELTSDVFNDSSIFSRYINAFRIRKKADLLIGGYNELRPMYSRSMIFNGSSSTDIDDEPRRLHIGTDIWGEQGTKVFAPLGGMVHSFAFNNLKGDYGATLILLHQLDGFSFYTLYGHLSLADITRCNEGGYVTRGELIGHFGKPSENGDWPPHLHLQIIQDIGLYQGDYPGVCKFSDREYYLRNCPDPDLILQLSRFAV